MKNSMKIHKIAGVLCALQSVTNLGSKCNQTPPLSPFKNDYKPPFYFVPSDKDFHLVKFPSVLGDVSLKKSN